MALSVALLTAACGSGRASSDERAVTAVVKQAAVASANGDYVEFCSLITGKALGQFGGEIEGRPTVPDCERRWRALGPGSSVERRAAARTRMMAVTVEGEQAGARYRAWPGVVVAVALRRRHGRWRISDLDPGHSLAELRKRLSDLRKSLNTQRDLDCSTFEFDPTRWRISAGEQTDASPTERQRLADALIKCRVLIGLSRSELIRMLGRPDNYVAQAGELSWTTGPERQYFVVDREHLNVRFGKRGFVRIASLITD